MHKEKQGQGRMAILGPLGTHSEAAGRFLAAKLPKPVELVIYPDIFAAIQAVEEGETESALVPVENSLEGSVNVTLDTLAHTDALCVLRELVWPVHNHLMAKCSMGKVRRILSHPQPISQCREYLRAHFPKAELIKTPSTARAAELVASEPASSGWAAICTERAGELNGLVTLATEIQDNMANATRFFQLVRRGSAEALPKATKTLIICQMDGTRPGALYEVLREFAERGINMTRIESRPARTTLGAYIFFFDLELGSCEETLAAALDAVREKCIWLRSLGKFPLIVA